MKIDAYAVSALLKIYAYIVAIILMFVSLIGAILPFLFSAKSTEAVLAGVALAVVSPIGIAILVKRLAALITPKEEDK